MNVNVARERNRARSSYIHVHVMRLRKLNRSIGYTGSRGASTLGSLDDVVVGTPANGYILTYLTDYDKYYVLPLEISNQTLDGGDF